MQHMVPCLPINNSIKPWGRGYVLPIWNDLSHYRPYHLQHHAKTSSSEDPDLCLIADLPTKKGH